LRDIIKSSEGIESEIQCQILDWFSIT